MLKSVFRPLFYLVFYLRFSYKVYFIGKRLEENEGSLALKGAESVIVGTTILHH